MRFLIDEMFHQEVAAWLRTTGHDSVHVAEIGLAGVEDAEIVLRAAAEDRVVVTENAVDFDALRRSGEFDRILVEADGADRKPLKASAPHEPVIASATDALVAVAGLNGLGLPLQEGNVFRAEIWARLTGTRPGSPVDAESIARMAVHACGFFKGCPAGARRILFLNRADTPERLRAATQVVEILESSRDRPPARVALGCMLPTPRIAGGAQIPAAESGHPQTLLLD